MMSEKTIKEIAEEMLENPKIQKAVEGIMSPLEQKGDSLTIQVKREELKKQKGDL